MTPGSSCGPSEADRVSTAPGTPDPTPIVPRIGRKCWPNSTGVEDRRAYFETIIALRFGELPLSGLELLEPLRRGIPLLAWGRVTGTITHEPRGDAGFGYDSIFQPDEGGGATFAEMSLTDKHAISHRGRALTDLVRILGLE